MRASIMKFILNNQQLLKRNKVLKYYQYFRSLLAILLTLRNALSILSGFDS